MNHFKWSRICRKLYIYLVNLNFRKKSYGVSGFSWKNGRQPYKVVVLSELLA